MGRVSRFRDPVFHTIVTTHASSVDRTFEQLSGRIVEAAIVACVGSGIATPRANSGQARRLSYDRN
jgi:hypothetical protein